VTAPHALVADDVARRLGTDLELGLDETQAEARLAEVGPNRLERAPRPAYARIALRQFTDPLVGLLVAAAVVSAAIGDGVEAAVIGAIVVLNALLGFAQESGAERRSSRSGGFWSSGRASSAPDASARSRRRSSSRVTSSSCRRVTGCPRTAAWPRPRASPWTSRS
jgi:hypothetical protein